jgi:prepilin-type processing-associated H-X9-DG protein
MGNAGGDGIRWFPKMSSINKPNAYFVTMDEDDVTINDAYFRVDVDRNPTLGAPFMSINDWPATYHGGSGGISFADGHAEKHQWKFLGRAPDGYKPAQGMTLTSSRTKDMSYLTQIASEPVDGWK